MKLINQNITNDEAKAINSREVAEMLGTTHGDLLASFSKSKESAKNIVYGMRGELRKGNGILLRQVYEGIDLIKLLRMWKTLYESNSEEKNDIMKLINNFREEKEIVSRLHKYEILE